MTDPSRSAEAGDDSVDPDGRSSTGMPGWVKVFGVVVAVVILLVIVVMMFGGGGQHGPGRHAPGAGQTGETAPIAGGGGHKAA